MSPDPAAAAVVPSLHKAIAAGKEKVASGKERDADEEKVRCCHRRRKRRADEENGVMGGRWWRWKTREGGVT
jgi:hypothetical protein